MGIENTCKYGTIDVYSDNKEGPYIKLEQLVFGLACNLPEDIAIEFWERLLGTEEFGKALVKVIKGDSDYELSSYSDSQPGRYAGDLVRAALLPHASEAAITLVAHIIEENQALRNDLTRAKKHIELLLKDWPDAYQKYVPKQVYEYISTPYLSRDDVAKLIENFAKDTPAPVATVADDEIPF